MSTPPKARQPLPGAQQQLLEALRAAQYHNLSVVIAGHDVTILVNLLQELAELRAKQQ
jgi:hypothetical protein